MNSRGEFNLQGMLIAMLISFGLIIGVFATTLVILGATYDTTGFEETTSTHNGTFSDYDYLAATVSKINQTETEINRLAVDKNAFDWFAALWAQIKAPFQYSYQSYTNMRSVTSASVDQFQLMPVFGSTLNAIIGVLVIIGIVMIGIYLGRKK